MKKNGNLVVLVSYVNINTPAYLKCTLVVVVSNIYKQVS